MPIESATYISDLNASNPLGSDAKSTADDHIRLNKTVLKNTFPNLNGAVTGLPAQLNAPVSGTSQASTSGTSIDFTGIPSWAKRISVCLSGVSLNATATVLVKLGDSGGIESAGYAGTVYSSSSGTSTLSQGFTVAVNMASTGALNGVVQLVLADASTNTWVASGSFGDANGFVYSMGGSKSTSATLDRLSVTTLAGTATFDAGLINIVYD